MPETRFIRQDLHAFSLIGMDGCGESLTITFKADRTTKAGTHEIHEIKLKMCRWTVGELLKQLKAMHARDRERINRELTRISNEQNALQVQS